MSTSYVAEFSCCVPRSVPRSGEQSQPLMLYVALFVIMLSKHRNTVAAYISTTRD